VTINEEFAFTLSSSVSDDDGALIEPLSVGVNVCRRAGIKAGDRVLVTGAGTIGNLVAQAAVVSGATEVVITDFNDRRLGAAAVIRPSSPSTSAERRSRPPSTKSMHSSNALVLPACSPRDWRRYALTVSLSQSGCRRRTRWSST
jgi:D-arabinose 1-dehydrogenase-like Zn-dependent alcohol dehydrogenase